MSVDAEANPTIIETAARVERHRRDEIRRYVILTLAVVTALFLFAIVSNLIGYRILSSLLEDVEEQNTQQIVALEEARQTALRNEAANDRILASIGDRLVPKAEVRRLQAQVIDLRRQAVKLRVSVRQLTALLDARLATGGG